jgi:FAD/FMN-containing dehydrogenase
LLVASEEENADLFWALRGGSGNFGVVTSLKYRLYEQGPVFVGLVAHPMKNCAEAPEVLAICPARWRSRVVKKLVAARVLLNKADSSF